MEQILEQILQRIEALHTKIDALQPSLNVAADIVSAVSPKAGDIVHQVVNVATNEVNNAANTFEDLQQAASIKAANEAATAAAIAAVNAAASDKQNIGKDVLSAVEKVPVVSKIVVDVEKILNDMKTGIVMQSR